MSPSTALPSHLWGVISQYGHDTEGFDAHLPCLRHSLGGRQTSRLQATRSIGSASRSFPSAISLPPLWTSVVEWGAAGPLGVGKQMQLRNLERHGWRCVGWNQTGGLTSEGALLKKFRTVGQLTSWKIRPLLLISHSHSI